MTKRFGYIVSLYAKGETHSSDCLPTFYATRKEAEAAGAEEVTRVVGIEPDKRHPQIDWAMRYTVRKVR